MQQNSGPLNFVDNIFFFEALTIQNFDNKCNTSVVEENNNSHNNSEWGSFRAKGMHLLHPDEKNILQLKTGKLRFIAK